MPELFNLPLIPGLRYHEDLIDPNEERGLIDALEMADLEPFRFGNWLGNRRTRTFGWRYDFEDRSFAPADPIPAWLLPLRSKVANFAELKDEDLVHILLARYDPGAGIGWHRDRDVFDEIVGISLGSPARLRFRRRRSDGFDRAALHLEPRSAYRLLGEARWQWEHSIAPGEQRRFSITFRKMSDKGRAIARGQSTNRVRL